MATKEESVDPAVGADEKLFARVLRSASTILNDIRSVASPCPAGLNLADVMEQQRVANNRPALGDDNPAIACQMFHETLSLGTLAEYVDDSELTPVLLKSHQGMRVYRETLRLAVAVAGRLALPHKGMFTVEHSFGLESSGMSSGYFCKFSKAVDEEDVKNLLRTVKELTKNKVPIVHRVLSANQAEKLFKLADQRYSAEYLSSRSQSFVRVLCCAGQSFLSHADHGIAVAPDFSLLSVYDITAHGNGGVLVRFPLLSDEAASQKTHVRQAAQGDSSGMKVSPVPQSVDEVDTAAVVEDMQTLVLAPLTPNPLILDVYDRSNAWAQQLDMESVGDVNRMVVNGKAKELVGMCEARVDAQVADIARKINANKKARLVLVGGPSASGKSTFAAKLGTQLTVFGCKPVYFSTDEYYRDTAAPEYPRTPQGQPDHEDLNALRLELLEDHLRRLLVLGEEVQVPVFDFELHRPSGTTTPLRLKPGQRLIMEGIFCLNAALAAHLDDALKYRVFISPLPQLNTDERHFLNNQHLRLMRRISRDAAHRGMTARGTIRRWPTVMRGEERNIFPHVHTAQAVINSS